MGDAAVSPADRGPLPIVIGVSGHREIAPAAVGRIQQRVRAIFDDLLERYPHTPLLLLSPLAVGGDRLVAHIALEPRYRIPIVVPTPFPLAEYEHDFTSPQRIEFRWLLARARCTYFVGLHPENQDGRALADRRARDLQYAQVGAYVVRNCQILIALWDGVAAPDEAGERLGGTAQIVRFQRTGFAPGFGPKRRPLDRPEFGPVYHVLTPRANDAPPAGDLPFEILWPDRGGTPEQSAADAKHDELVTKRIFERMDEFNGDALGLKIRADRLETERIRDAAERLATRYQWWTLRTLLYLYRAALIGAAAFVIYAHFEPKWLTLLIYIVITVAALAGFGLAERGKWPTRHQDYRAITEGLRVQKFWQLSDIRETVADHYLRQHRGELDWIRHAIRVCRLLDDTAERQTRTLEGWRAALQSVLDQWILGNDGQMQYFARHERLDRGRASMLHLTSKWLFVASSVLVGFAALYFHLFTRAATSVELDMSWKTVIVVIAMLAVVSGLAESFADKHAFSAHAKRNALMSGMFEQAHRQLKLILARRPFTGKDVADAQDVIHDLGDESLVEQGEWMRIHRERPMEFVRGVP